MQKKFERKDHQAMEITMNLDEKRQLLAAYRSGELSCERSTAYWTQEERAELEEAFRAGIGISELSLFFQRSETAIYQQLIALGLTATSGTRGPRKPKPSRCECPRCLEAKCPYYDEKRGLCNA